MSVGPMAFFSSTTNYDNLWRILYRFVALRKNLMVHYVTWRVVLRRHSTQLINLLTRPIKTWCGMKGSRAEAERLEMKGRAWSRSSWGRDEFSSIIS